MSRPLHPRHGIHDPARSTPARAPGSIRRTSSIDMLRPDGLASGQLVLVGRARDLCTGFVGGARVLGEAGFLARVDFLANRKIVALHTVPEAETAALVGVTVSSGFRAELDRVLPRHRDARSLLYLLLDDVPVASLVSGYAFGAAGVSIPVGRSPGRPRPDLCAGWRSGGTMLVEIEREGRVPSSTGPAAPKLERADDPLAWHRMDALPAHGMRRHRRLDLVSGDGLLVDAFFRDSHMGSDGEETIVHEYAVRARIEPTALEILDIEATARTLPWIECEAAPASARHLAGLPLSGLRSHVRASFTGTLTCTHLNDTLRSLEDVVALAARLPRAPGAGRADARSGLRDHPTDGDRPGEGAT